MLIRRILSLTLVAAHVSAQQEQRQNLPVNSVNAFTVSSSSSDAAASFGFERGSEQTTYYVSLSLCTDVTPYPTFYVSNGPLSNLTLTLDAGFATWNGTSSNGIVIYALPAASIGTRTEWSFQLAVSTTGYFHKLLNEAPRIGDTTSSVALLFSPAFLLLNDFQPGFPNYTFPVPDLPPSSPPSTPSNSTLVFFPETKRQDRLFQSACALKEIPSLISTRNSSFVLRDLGWKVQYLIEGLNPEQRYIAYSIAEDSIGSTLSQPATVITKSAGYTCPLVHSLPFCPQVAWSTPLPAPSGGSTTYTASTLPSSLHDALVGSMSNFTRSLSTFACGRDIYSLLQSCADCERAYRIWLCEMILPRCGEPPASSLDLAARNLPNPALLPRTTNPFQGFGVNDGPTNWMELLPCLEVCQIVDRACPPVLQWGCPTADVNANRTYGVGFIDAWNGKMDNGSPGYPQNDTVGVAFCNWGRWGVQ